MRIGDTVHWEDGEYQHRGKVVSFDLCTVCIVSNSQLEFVPLRIVRTSTYEEMTPNERAGSQCGQTAYEYAYRCGHQEEYWGAPDRCTHPPGSQCGCRRTNAGWEIDPDGAFGTQGEVYYAPGGEYERRRRGCCGSYYQSMRGPQGHQGYQGSLK